MIKLALFVEISFVLLFICVMQIIISHIRFVLCVHSLHYNEIYILHNRTCQMTKNKHDIPFTVVSLDVLPNKAILQT